jgi:uncharacterized membrane protein
MNIIYILGNFTGRIFIGYLIVWLFYFFINKFKWRIAFKQSARWYSWLAVILMTLLGLGASFARQGGLV